MNVILNLPGFSIKKVSGYQPLVLYIHYHRQPRCGHCHSKHVRKKDNFIRTVSHELIGHRRTLLRFKAYKLYCYGCHRYSNQQFPGILKYQRSTERLRAQVYHQHTRGVSQKALALQFNKGKATIERWYHHQYRSEHKERMNAPCPTVLGLDEHFFSRKQGFATTLCDLKKHKVFDIVKGKTGNNLHDYLQQLPDKHRVKVVCIDLCNQYRQRVKRYFSNASIVADRFHVIRLVNHHFMKAYQLITPEIKYQRGLLAMLKTNPANLSASQLSKRQHLFNQQPPLAAAYFFKQRLHRLLMKKHRNKKQCQRLLPVFLKFIAMLKQSPFASLQTLGKTLFKWREEIVRMWRFTKNNGITEGFHRKMKLIQRRAYGFRNFENYRIRVKVLCG